MLNFGPASKVVCTKALSRPLHRGSRDGWLRLWPSPKLFPTHVDSYVWANSVQMYGTHAVHFQSMCKRPYAKAWQIYPESSQSVYTVPVKKFSDMEGCSSGSIATSTTNTTMKYVMALCCAFSSYHGCCSGRHVPGFPQQFWVMHHGWCVQGLKQQGTPMRAFLSTLQTLISIAPCSRIFEHQSLEDEDSEEEEDEAGDGAATEARQQPQASTSAPTRGVHGSDARGCSIQLWC